MKKYVEVHGNFRSFFEQNCPSVAIQFASISGHFVINSLDFERVFVPSFFPSLEKLKQSFVGVSCHEMDQAEFDRMVKLG